MAQVVGQSPSWEGLKHPKRPCRLGDFFCEVLIESEDYWQPDIKILLVSKFSGKDKLYAVLRRSRNLNWILTDETSSFEEAFDTFKGIPL